MTREIVFIRSNCRMYRRSAAITAFREFAGRGHWIIAQDGWQEVAGFIAEWLAALPDLRSP